MHSHLAAISEFLTDSNKMTVATVWVREATQTILSSQPSKSPERHDVLANNDKSLPFGDVNV